MANQHHESSSSTPVSTASAHPSANQSSADYEGFDPELPDSQDENRKFLGLSSVQVGASALAAVTSALAASFFGVAGTLIGAAVGSVISTIAGAMYAESMRRAGGRLREAQTIVIQRTAIGTETRPTQLPPPESLTRVDVAAADETIVLPADVINDGATAVAARPDSDAPTVVGASGQDLAETTILRLDDLGAAAAGTGGAGGSAGGDDAVRAKSPWYRRPVIALPIVGIVGFVIAIGVITGVEALTGHTFSGGSGTSLSKLSGGSTSTDKPTPSATVTVTPTESSQPTVTETTTPETSASSAPEPTASATPSTGPSTSSVAPTTEPADPGAASTGGTADRTDSASGLDSGAQQDGSQAQSTAVPGN